MRLPSFIRRFVHHTYVKRLVAFFSALQITILLGIATLWILALVSDNNIALTWGLWRLVDFAILINSFAVYVYVDQVREKALPAVVTFTLAGLVVLADLASLIWFGILYRDCKQAIVNGIASTDPLCQMGNFDKISLYYLILTSILSVLNLLYGILVGSLLLILVMNDGFKSEDYGTRGIRSHSVGVSDQHKSLARDKRIQYAMNFFSLGWVFIVVEVCILVDKSIISYFFYAHALQAVIIVQTFVSLKDPRIDKIFFGISAFALLASGLGGLLVSCLYYIWNCTASTHGNFANTSGCEVGISGARYMIALHSFMTGIALLRILVYAHTLKNQPSQFSFGPRGHIETMDDLAEADANLGKVIRRSAYHILENGESVLPMTSALTGQNIMF